MGGRGDTAMEPSHWWPFPASLRPRVPASLWGVVLTVYRLLTEETRT
jgi:hypothetical protein